MLDDARSVLQELSHVEFAMVLLILDVRQNCHVFIDSSNSLFINFKRFLGMLCPLHLAVIPLHLVTGRMVCRNRCVVAN